MFGKNKSLKTIEKFYTFKKYIAYLYLGLIIRVDITIFKLVSGFWYLEEVVC